MNQSSLFQLAHICQRVFDAYALSIYETNSALEYEERMTSLGKVPVQRPFDGTRHVLPPHRISALLLQYQGRDIGGVMARFLDLGEQPLCDLLDEEASVLYGSNRPRRMISPTAQRIKGRVAYLGEMLLEESAQDPSHHWRNRPGLAAALVRYLQCLSFSRWQCDWVYAIIRKNEVERRGRVTQYGFSVAEPNFQNWEDVSDKRRDSTEYLVANSEAQFSHIISVCCKDPIAYFPGYAELYSKAKQMAEDNASDPSNRTLALKDQ